MPTYEYRCKDCGEELEVVQSFQDDPLTECPHCQGRLRKVFGSIGISFKGSGFYKNDSRTAAGARSSGNGGESGSSSGNGSEGSGTSASDKSSSSSGSNGGSSGGDSGSSGGESGSSSKTSADSSSTS